MLETGRAPESFPERIVCASVFNNITNWESQQVHSTCLAQANEAANFIATFRPCVSVVQDRKRPGNIMKNDHLTNLRTVRMISELNTQKRVRQSLHARENDLSVQSTLSFQSEKWIQDKMPAQLPASHIDLNQEEVTAFRHRPQGCAVDHLPRHERSIRVVGDHSLSCNPPVCAFGDHVLLEQEKNR